MSDAPGSASPGGVNPNNLSADELDAILAAAQGQPPASRGAPPDSSAVQADDPSAIDMDAFAQADAEVAAAAASATPGPTAIGGAAGPFVSEPTPFATPNFAPSSATVDLTTIEMLDDVELEVTIELGRTEMYIEDVLRLGVGSVVELNKLAGDPVDIYVNHRLVARGEVLVLNENFCVRIADILSPVPELEHAR